MAPNYKAGSHYLKSGSVISNDFILLCCVAFVRDFVCISLQLYVKSVTNLTILLFCTTSISSLFNLAISLWYQFNGCHFNKHSLRVHCVLGTVCKPFYYFIYLFFWQTCSPRNCLVLKFFKNIVNITYFFSHVTKLKKLWVSLCTRYPFRNILWINNHRW